ncbi:glucose dehydrogenase [FAD, quinone]-like [Wyeomyia smithii]|uniref:glucose dehydrogenase [FAD, quinone]-like n=1 Tax=Wyeomyia smithii TaxID=174621 RepID=UPI0024681B2E|nr:glucose dehydrogenase [FAD, quinone]-like [Wyeomyia smithii]
MCSSNSLFPDPTATNGCYHHVDFATAHNRPSPINSFSCSNSSLSSTRFHAAAMKVTIPPNPEVVLDSLIGNIREFQYDQENQITFVKCYNEVVKILTSLGKDGNATLGDYVDFSSVWGLDYGDPNPKIRKSYDFIIIGAGPAGCVMANRLSENPSVNVLLLELGKAEILLTQDIPILSFYQPSTDYNFGYVTEPQAGACLGMEDKRCPWHYGRGLGGSSIINNMIYTRGNFRDFDSWNASGNPGWSYNDVLPYFIKAEDANLRDFQYNGFHGKGGYLAVEHSPYQTPLVSAYISSAQRVGLPYIDYNSRDQIGVSYTQYTSRRGLRWTAARALLNPIRKRKNLHVLTRAWATKVLIDANTKTANGVQYTRNKKTFKVKAKREVILSAGTFESAKLLMLSGIGPKEHLRDMGVDVIQDLPVGETLYEHPGAIGPVFTVDRTIDENINIEALINVPNVIKYLFSKGPFTSALAEGLAYIKTPFSPYPADPDWPDVELCQIAIQVGDDPTPGVQDFFRLDKRVLESFFRPLFNVRAFMYLPVLMHTRTKGSLKLKSSNPYDHPVFNYQYFEDERDLDALVYGIKVAINITSQKPFTDLGVRLYSKKVPGCEQFEFNSDQYWRCYVRVLTATYHHYVGTCRMGPSSDPAAVVDSRLRVHGVNRLRVADAGIAPAPPTAHTAAIAYMIGEKGADMVKSDNGL